MCQSQPERTPMAVYERPEPTTLPPTSRNIRTTNCCSHCGSGIDTENKNCERCGAPNENYKQKEIIDDENQKIFSEAFGNYVQSSIENEINSLMQIKIVRIQQGLDTKDIDKKLKDANSQLNDEEVLLR